MITEEIEGSSLMEKVGRDLPDIPYVTFLRKMCVHETKVTRKNVERMRKGRIR